MSAPRRPTQIYDAIIVGSELAGLVAGAALARRGFRVLHVEEGKEGPDRKEAGYLLPNRPDLLPPPRALPSLHALLDELGLMPKVGRSFAPHPQGLQLLLSDARLDLLPQPEDRARELERAFGPAGPAFSRALEALDLPIAPWIEAAAHLPANGLRDAWKLRGPARKLRAHVQNEEADDPLRKAAQALYALLAPAPGGLVGLSRALSPLLPQPSFLPVPRLPRVLQAFIASHRGESLEAWPEAVVVERGFGGVRFEGLSVPYRGKLGILALPPERAAVLFSGRIRRRIEAEAARFEPRAREITWNLVLDARGIPPGLGSLALATTGKEPLLLSMEPSRDEEGQEVEGLRTITATAHFDRGLPTAEAAATLRSALEDILPFYERHLRHESLREGRTARVEIAGKRPLGIEGLGARGPIRRSLWASRLSLPGLGIEGELLAGLRAARIAQAWLAKA